MSNQSYTTSFTVEQTPREVFEAITNPRRWWMDTIKGDTDKLGAVFYHHYQDLHHCVLEITELVPGKKVVWRVLHNDFNFVTDKSEWIGTDIVFEIATKGGKTHVKFTHVGLVRSYECYGVCSDSWSVYITGSLRDLIAKGKGQPDPNEAVVTTARKMLEEMRE
jgi:uncharacterized protein YndB with AHSA1/START domain